MNFAERSRDGVLTGYQRERVASHISQILAYLRQKDALLPNAIVIAFDKEVAFSPLPGVIRSEWGTPGHLIVPLPGRGGRKPGFIVDGRQMLVCQALAQLEPSRQFPVVVVGFTALSADLQREQFVLVNKTKPLPRDLLNELLPHVGTELPKPWRLRRVAAGDLGLLRYNKESPFYGRIRGVGSYGEGNISQAAVLGVIEGSIRRGGVLSGFYSAATDTADIRSDGAHRACVFQRRRAGLALRLGWKSLEQSPRPWRGNQCNGEPHGCDHGRGRLRTAQGRHVRCAALEEDRTHMRVD